MEYLAFNYRVSISLFYIYYIYIGFRSSTICDIGGLFELRLVLNVDCLCAGCEVCE